MDGPQTTSPTYGRSPLRYDKNIARGVVQRVLGLGAEDEVRDDAHFIDELGADSLDHVELIMGFEEAFEIEIPDDVGEKIVCLNDLYDYVRADYERA